MADESPPNKRGVSRFLGGRWRSRSDADETKNLVQQQQKQQRNVADFLGEAAPMGPPPTSNPSAASRPRPGPPQAPKIDIAAAQRWTGGSAELTPSLRGRTDSTGSRHRKQPRRPNLTVSFNTVPEVMGEGGG